MRSVRIHSLKLDQVSGQGWPSPTLSQHEIVPAVYAVKPMASLIITRRLYLIASLQSAVLADKAARRKNLLVEWTLGFVIPVAVAGPTYYVLQNARFGVCEGFGCTNTLDGSILNILLTKALNIIPPLLSMCMYYPKVARVFYRQSRDNDHFLQTDGSGTIYLRIIILSSIDILFTLPIGIVQVTLYIANSLSNHQSAFYNGWTADHTYWEPIVFTYASTLAGGTSSVAQFYFSQWASTIRAFAIFGLFGVTSEARASYWKAIRTVGSWFGWKPASREHRARSSLNDIEFGKPSQDASLNLEAKLQTSHNTSDARIPKEGSWSEDDSTTPSRELKDVPDMKAVEGPHGLGLHHSEASLSRDGSSSAVETPGVMEIR
ncbi:hypothetical protein PENSPDRAFT_187058 [Peniophora sp. CONT]|nr:hypothetical protein PENSPDRAFT_187058 [Peniophora sp. CONT]